MNDQLTKEFQYFLDNLSTLLEQYRGKFLVIRHQSVQGAFDSEEEAIREGMKKYQLGTFLVQECSDDENAYTRTFRSRVSLQAMSKPAGSRELAAKAARRELAWEARGFGHSKAHAISARQRGNIETARYFAAQCREHWRKLSELLNGRTAI